jgi:hypothetical protein
MANVWLTHVKSTMASMKKAGTYKKGDGLKKVILAAKKTYKSTRRASKKGRRGGEEKDELPAKGEAMPESESPSEGGRRGRKSRSTRRKSRR